MKQKKVTIIITHDYRDQATASNAEIARRLRRVLRQCESPREQYFITVEDM